MKSKEIKFKTADINNQLNALVIAKKEFFKKTNDTVTPIKLIPKIKGTWNFKHSLKCIVCFMEIENEKDLVRCPHCSQPAHKEHIEEWLRTKNTCPVCKRYWKI